jgi:hypothetical protein
MSVAANLGDQRYQVVYDEQQVAGIRGFLAAFCHVVSAIAGKPRLDKCL